MSGTGSVGSVLLDMVAFGDVYWRLAGAILHSVSWVNVRDRERRERAVRHGSVR